MRCRTRKGSEPLTRKRLDNDEAIQRMAQMPVKTKEKKPLKLPEGHILDDWSRDGKYFLTTRFGVDKDKPQARLRPAVPREP